MARRDRSRPFLKELQQVLDKIPTKATEGSLEDGELYICATCNLPLKVCELHGGSRCASMLRGNTQLEILESSIHDVLTAAGRHCLRCGKALSARLLKRNPSRELCSDCSPTALRKRRKKPSPGASS